MLAATTPTNLTRELARLEGSWRASTAVAPRFEYQARQSGMPELARALADMADTLDGEGPLGRLYAGRAREMAMEADICACSGTSRLWGAARRRYRARDAFDGAADAVARAWLDERGPDEPGDDATRSDDEADSGSLLCRMREEVDRHRLPLRVVVKEDLAALAATGDGVVQVTAGRALRRRDVERTVLHEIHGHALPRAAASGSGIGIFALGTAFGSDDQEGRALALERAASFLDHARRRELALRHTAARDVEARADFVETVRALLDRGAPLTVALRIAARAHRGGGLARESVYLPALLRVEAAIARDPDIDRLLARGRVAVDAAEALRGW